ncbi:hypothetical protein QE392_003377 [Microbacterium proteolyticum]|nr:hypothetical protein [Microbacterium proteolyticum]
MECAHHGRPGRRRPRRPRQRRARDGRRGVRRRADQPRPPRLPARRDHPSRRCAGSLDLPPGGGADPPRPVDLRRRARGRHLRAGGRRAARPRDGRLGPGRVQCRRQHPRGRRVHPALGADRRPRQPAEGLRVASDGGVSPDDGRPVGGQRRAVDAARRRPEPFGGAHRTARPLRFRTELLDGPHRLGARRGLRRLCRRRPGFRRLFEGPPRPLPRRDRARRAVAVRPVRRGRRHQGAGVAHRGRSGCHGRGRPRIDRRRPGGR